jgi:uncharacterized membrane protein
MGGAVSGTSPTEGSTTVPSEPLAAPAKKNIAAIARVEQTLARRGSPVERVGDWVAHFFGSLWFIAAHAAAIAGWVWWNARRPADAPGFDPYPFPLLGLVVGVEFIVLTAFVLMNQAAQARRQEHWGHLTLQVDLLAEQEMTKVLQTLDLVCRKLGVEPPSADPEAGELARPTQVAALAEEVEKAREAG